jgi:PKD repeat protein
MNRIARFSRTATLAILSAIVILAASCTMKNQDAPPLMGPSEFGTSIGVTVSPDVLALDGASQSLVTITVLDPNSKPVRNLSLRAEISVGGIRADFGSLSARNVVTGSDGRATLVYTAPGAPNGPTEDPSTLVDILVTPIGTDYNNQSSRLASIRLVAPGIVIPPGGGKAAFTFSPSAPTDHQSVLFDASTSTSTGLTPIATYSWDFDDGETSSGKITSHAFDEPGTYIVTLTIADQFNRTDSIKQAVTVTGGATPTVALNVSPAAPVIGQDVNFNASGTVAAAGRTIRSYRWDFGDGTVRTTTSPITSHDYELAGTFTVTLLVTDDAGRFATMTVSVTIAAAAQAGQVSVPSLFGLTQAAATTAITSAGLIVGTQTSASSSAPVGTVIFQTPAAGTLVASGSTVDIVVAQP